MTSPEHINVLVWASVNFSHGGIFEFKNSLGHWKTITREHGMDEIGQILVDANVAALTHGETSYPYSYSHPANSYWGAVDVFKAVLCYKYQAGDAPNWENSDAERYCRKLLEILPHALPGFEDSPWGIEANSTPAAQR